MDYIRAEHTFRLKDTKYIQNASARCLKYTKCLSATQPNILVCNCNAAIYLFKYAYYTPNFAVWNIIKLISANYLNWFLF